MIFFFIKKSVFFESLKLLTKLLPRNLYMVLTALILALSITDQLNTSLNTGPRQLPVFRNSLLLSLPSVPSTNSLSKTSPSWLNLHVLATPFKSSTSLFLLLLLKNKRLSIHSLPCLSFIDSFIHRPTLHSWSTLHSIQFPEKRLVEYDCGKLQVLSTFYSSL